MKKNILILKWIYSLLLVFPLLFSAQEGTKQVSPTSTNLSGLDYNPTIDSGSFDIHPKTFVTSDTIDGQTYIDVDSTNGFESSGKLLVYIGNNSYKEISYTLNVPAKCVDNALTRIRKKASEVYVQFKDDEKKDASHKMPKK